MAIQTYGDIKAAVADYADRRDLTAQIVIFLQKTHIELVEYVGPLPPLVNDSDTNALTIYDPFTYIYGALAEMSTYLRDSSLATFVAKYEEKLTNLAQTGLDFVGSSPNTVFMP